MCSHTERSCCIILSSLLKISTKQGAEIRKLEKMIKKKYKAAITGSGNWGSVAAKLVASNTLNLDSFHDEVRMWVFEETLPNGEKLTDIINTTNENIKYLPGIKLGHSVVADPDLEHAVEDANMLVFVTPHQFIEGICKILVGKIKGDVEAISLIKGMEVKTGGPCMISSLINKQLGVNCCVLMGANIGDEKINAMEKFSEATIGYTEDKEVAQRWVQIFGTPYFRVSAVFSQARNRAVARPEATGSQCCQNVRLLKAVSSIPKTLL